MNDKPTLTELKAAAYDAWVQAQHWQRRFAELDAAAQAQEQQQREAKEKDGGDTPPIQ